MQDECPENQDKSQRFQEEVKMFDVSLHRHLKKERNNYEHAANTPRYEHASVTLPSHYGHVQDACEMLA
jgi:hypothetical protein